MRHLFDGLFRTVRMTGCASGTLLQYSNAVAHWERVTGDLPIEQATDVALASVLADLLAKGDTPATANKVLRHLLSLLRFAAARGLIDSAPELGKLKEPRRIPRAWLLEEVEAILSAARKQPGAVSGLRACLWWESLLMACYDCGGRIGAILATKRADLDLSAGLITLRPEHQKDCEEQTLALHADTLAAIRKIAPELREIVWPWPHRRETLYRAFRRIVNLAGVEVGHGANSLFHRLRRTNASYLKAAGGDPTLQLGHSSSAVTRRYLDPRICGQQRAADMLPRPKIA